MSFLEKFDRDFAGLLAGRAATFRMLFEHMEKIKHPVHIVETGCLRDPGNWAGDGQSTLLFDAWVKTQGGTAWSVDISEQSIAGAVAAGVEQVRLVQRDSISFLSKFNMGIDVLYLDSFDYSIQDAVLSEHHNLFELCAAQRWLHRQTLIMIDDTMCTQGQWHGKGKVTAAYMKAVGAIELSISLPGPLQQVLWKLEY